MNIYTSYKYEVYIISLINEETITADCTEKARPCGEGLNVVWVARVWAGATPGDRAGPSPWSWGGLGRGLPARPPPPAASGLPSGSDVARLRAAARAPDPEAGPRKPRASRGRRAGREESRGRSGLVGVGGGDVEEVTPRPGGRQTSGRGARGCNRIPGAAAWGGGCAERRPRRHPAPTPAARRAGAGGGQRPSGARLGARGRGRAPPGGRLGGRGRGRAPERVGGRGRGRGAAAPRAAPGARGPRQGPGGAMAAGSITTLPALPEDGGSGAFPPGHFKDPKRLYCKNGGFFLRIHPDGRVDGVREKSDPHIKLQLQAEERGVVSIKGVCANRYLAMKEDGRLLASKCVTDECFFFERLESNNYNTYRSRKYSSWYVALKRTGQYKLGPKTGPGQKAILFLPMSAKS
ncbi:LOW QUALITY PROTEIN: fibroblast growth factor 2 [Equus quagga]|uniref:LOW QUALITY PROTEIN: fibroblast growth factor 2 n=1 Tax=Equus quagga TaxID=89248 RepID=UPI001EE2FE31|nr:LOW QUALITY PROTEIN: fibroblast growth factor 2 [Equus quagga]